MFVIEHILSPNLLSISSVRRRQNDPGDNRKSLESWYLSGVGKDVHWDGDAPPSGYDMRDKYCPLYGDYVVAYTSRYDLAALCVFLTLRSLQSKLCQSTY